MQGTKQEIWNIAVRTGDGLCFGQPQNIFYPQSVKPPRQFNLPSGVDLFADTIPFNFLKHVIGIIAVNPRHRFTLVTEHMDRAASILFGDALPNVMDGYYCTGGSEIPWPLENLSLQCIGGAQAGGGKAVPVGVTKARAAHQLQHLELEIRVTHEFQMDGIATGLPMHCVTSKRKPTLTHSRGAGCFIRAA